MAFSTFIRTFDAITFGRRTFKNVLQFALDTEQVTLSESDKEDLAKVFYWQDTEGYYFRAFSTKVKMDNAYKALMLKYGEYFNAAADDEVISEEPKKKTSKKSSKKQTSKKSEELDLEPKKKTSKKSSGKKSSGKKTSPKKSEELALPKEEPEDKKPTAKAVAELPKEVPVRDFLNKTLDLFEDANGDKYRYTVLDYLQNNTKSIDRLTELQADFVGQTGARFLRNEKEIAKLKKENAELRKQFARLEKKLATASK